MPVFEHVLVATDFGKAAERAAELGVSFAQKFGAKLTLLFVFSFPNSAFVTGGSLHLVEIEREARQSFEAEAARLKELFPELVGVMRTGTPWEEIIAAAKQMGVDLIVMGTHGRRGLPRALLGSVAEKVVRAAHVPVMTVAASGQRDEAPRAEEEA